METVDTDVFWSRVVAAPDCFGELQATDAAWHERAVVVWRVVGETLVQREGNDMLVAAWENNLGLAAADGAEPGARKVALLNHMCSEGLPVPAGLLESVLTRMLGEGRARVKHSGDTLTVSVAQDTTEEQIAEVQKMLDRVLPRNLVTEIDPFPCDFTRVEYLESTGTQYIDTAWILKEENNYSFELTLGHVGWKNWAWFYGIRDESTGTHYSISANYNFNDSHETPVLQLTYGANASLYFIAFTVHYGEDTRLVYEKSANTVIYNEVTKTNSAVFENPHDLPFYLFATKRIKSSGATDMLTSKIRIGYFKAKDNLMEMNMVAALDSTGTPCMFDTVSKTPFYNSGTGDFLYPGKAEEATTYSLRNRMYAKYTEHGIRRLYRVPKGYNSKEEYAEKHGFKILVETPMPEEGYWTPVWHEREDYIELEWVETEAPEEGLEP